MCPQLRQQCRDIVIEENLIERETQAGLIIFGNCPTDKNFKIVKLYVYLPETQANDKKHVLVLFPSIEKGVAYRMKLVCDEAQSLYFACFAMPENTTWTVRVQWRDLQLLPEISSRSCAYFVELKNSQGLGSFFSNLFAKQKSPYVYIVQHLMESIHDEESFQFALSAIRDMDTVLQAQIDDLQSLLKEKIQQFDKGTSIFESVYQFVFLCERMGDQRRQWLSPWQLFLAVQSIVKIANCATNTWVYSILLSDLKNNINGQSAGNHPKAEHFNMFVLIPCFNLLTRTSTRETKQSMLPRFRFQHIQKVEQMDQKCMDVIETDLKLRQVVGDNVKLFAEEQLIHVLNSCKDDTLSEAMLEFLIDNSLMTANSWKRMWSINNTICWNVIYGVYKHHIEKWSPFVAHLCKNNALQDEQVRKALFKGFNEKLFQAALIKSEDDFLLFIGFIVQNKSAMYSILTLYPFLSLCLFF
ncbi:hypothetical protein RFI_26170 [Reticulomyxa filosa]|uniref:Uncharacterized protein n=1 Tax=Reticulomyxa filosa TaxID=46433 RepID=X6MC00_RETFI|nr:hypothetical protein RFI_26170 [Reticulomyxa filosa]|eukprot:ETO11206.1 hypothetical protein RFI_26170 [Reticulomyxa filosa]